MPVEYGDLAPTKRSFGGAEYRRLGVLYGVIGVLHVVGWGLFNAYSSGLHNVLYAGAGSVAYTLGLRHAFDADHISAIDDTTRLLMRRGRAPLAIGFFFSLGHASVVLGVSATVAIAARRVLPHLDCFRDVGSLASCILSAGFLYGVALLNLMLLFNLLRASRAETDGDSGPRGLLGRWLSPRLTGWVEREWQMAALGVLFGLGFDTATEIGLLGVTAAASAGGLPVGAFLALPILFAAGMCLLDTTDGVLMVWAYAWAVQRPDQRRKYNLVTTGLTAGVALTVGTLELGGTLVERMNWHGGLAAALAAVNGQFETLGGAIVAVFMLVWAIAVVRSRNPKAAGISEG